MRQPLGPVSEHLVSTLEKLTRAHGVVVWLDRDGDYTALVDALAGVELGFALRAFRGSLLELVLGLEGCADTEAPPRLVVHLPGFNEQRVREGPLLELFRAGRRHRIALHTAVEEAAAGRVRPEQLQARLKGGVGTLLEADQWLAGLLNAGDGEVALQLDDIPLPTLFEDLLGGGLIARQMGATAASAEAVWARLAAQTGVDEAWRDAALSAASHGSPLAKIVEGLVERANS